MALRKLGKDPESPDGKSPTVYLDEARHRPRGLPARLADSWDRVTDITRVQH